jgi:shikimate 5-dehydrogenase
VPEASTKLRKTVLIGLIGAGIQPSRSPALHMAEGAAQGLLYICRLIDLDHPDLAAVPRAELIVGARRFGRTARAIGCRTMAVFQAVAAFRLFTGLKLDADRMLRHFADM